MPSPAKDPPARGRGRGGRGRGRGRGRGGRGGASAAAAAAASSSATKPNGPARGGRGGARRGRAKNFADSRVQAAYERQRDLKATYQAVTHAMKPALQELAERNIEELMNNPDFHKDTTEYSIVSEQLKAKLDKALGCFESQLEYELEFAEGKFEAENNVTLAQFENGVDDLDEIFTQGQENRLRIISSLHRKGLPTDVRDDRYEYKVISDLDFQDAIGPFEDMVNNIYVPYPSRVPGTETWERARKAAEAALVTAATAAVSTPTSAPSGRGRGRGRGGWKRKLQEQPDGMPTPKRSARGLGDPQMLASLPSAPAPTKGLLASAAAEPDVLEDPSADDDDDDDSSSEAPDATAGAMQVSQGRRSFREKSPALPKIITDADEHGVRSYHQRAIKDRPAVNRYLVPHPFWFEDHEIGFRDTANAPGTKGHSRHKRGKCLGTPNSNGMHYEHWCNGFDYTTLASSDFDQELVKHHGIHKSLGFFLHDSTNDAEDPKPCTMPGKPVVYISEGTSQISHASRSFQAATNGRMASDAPYRLKFGASLRRFCKLADIDPQEVSVDDFVPSLEELRVRSLGTAAREIELQQEEDKAAVADEQDLLQQERMLEAQQEAEETAQAQAALTSLLSAAEHVETQEAPRTPKPTPKPKRYDAIRDVFAPAVPEPSTDALDILADLCGSAVTAPPDTVASNGLSSGPPVEYSGYSRSMAANEPIAHHDSYGRELRAVHAEPPRDYSYPPQFSHPQHVQHPPSNGSVHYPHPEPAYHGAHDPYVIPRPSSQAYHPAPPGPPPPPPPPPHEYGAYHHQGPYAVSDTRESHLAAHQVDPAYDMHRRSTYTPAEPQQYHDPYWSQHMSPQGHPGPQGQPPNQMAPTPRPPSAHPYPPMARGPFAAQAMSADPLPPLRPPRGRSSLPETSPLDPPMRQGVPDGSGSYYSGSLRGPYRGFPNAEPMPPLQTINPDRILPSPQQSMQSYMTSPHQAYPPQMSPDFTNAHIMSHGGVQSPLDNSMGMPPQHHRGAPSAGSDPNNKYRKLQPAPVPAHRVWSHNKPELKTIPYDHKETGSAAALPSSGPTQIRGWAVNQPRKRPRTDKPDRADPANEREESR